MKTIDPAYTASVHLLKRQSIQRKLPFLIFILLLVMMLAFGWLSYIGIRNTAEKAAKERLLILAQQLAGMYTQSAVPVLNSTRAAAANPAVKSFLLSAGKDSAVEVDQLLQKLKLDSTWINVQLLNANGQEAAASNLSDVYDSLELSSIIPGYPTAADTGVVSRIYIKGEAFYYAICGAVTDKGKLIGYLLRWRKMYNSKENIERVSQLLGKQVVLYVGNADGSLWSDLRTAVDGLPATPGVDKALITYKRNSRPYLAAQTLVHNTQWKVMVTMPEANMLQPAKEFLKIAISSALLLLIIGIVLTWLLSRSITKPLDKLAIAARRIAKGDFSQTVELKRADELGVLSHAFNVMAKEVNDTQKNLEAIVAKRTTQLEQANKELEAFSYSVSHDLRAPLRAVSGYATMLREDHGTTLNEDGKRIADAIVTNARMMGQLIDDLISFSRISKKETEVQEVNMQQLVEQVVAELKAQRPEKNYRFIMHALPVCKTDQLLIKQVWLNLVDNAMKYSSLQDQPVIEIGATHTNGKVEYYVKDNGVGFDMKYSDKLFGVFQRLHRQDEFEGTGIGLALVKRIVDRQNGSLRAEGKVGEGAVFAFSFS
ncbi:ATP-binding protein [Lacibacter sp.]|uniref:ATP-binding protein n=1 Tax=Lacibacter sp. TaxID=1915409 RepID=UPI002B4AC3A9|nr:ATP-binding protein [Lacibacter sp.]HLP35953.1 ATP-binding protein [Lacibacter sp.]